MPAVSVAFDRRRLLRLAGLAALAWQTPPWVEQVAAALGPLPPTAPGVSDPVGYLGTSSDPETTTLEALADTMIPGAKRFDGDVAVAGAVPGPGAVAAGALDLMRLPAAGIAPTLPLFAGWLNQRAAQYAAERRLALDPSLPPFVALSFADRTRLAVTLLDPAAPDYLAWYALAAMAFLAFHTAGHLHTVDAVRHGHPGLRFIGFPAPDRDGLWRFPRFSYRRALSRPHPRTHRSGSPA